MARFRPLYAIAVLASVVFLPLRAEADPYFDYHVVNTSVAFGTAFGDLGGFVLDRHDVAAGSLLTPDLANDIANTYPVFADPQFAPTFPADPQSTPPLSGYATLDNLTLLTADLTGFGNAGNRLVGLYTQIFTDLNALIGGVGTWTLTLIPVDTPVYTLFGGVVNPGDRLGSSQDTCPAVGGDVCVVFGDATVSVYEVTGTFDPHGATLPAAAVPEPGTLALLGVGLAVLEITRRKKAAQV